MPINDKTRPALEQHPTASAAAKSVWRKDEAICNKVNRLRRVWNGKGWPWPAKWTVRGRVSQYFERRPKIKTEAGK